MKASNPKGAVAQQYDWQKVRDETFGFIGKCLRPDGGYAPSPDPDYQGNSDTSLSDLAAVTYAAVLARTCGLELCAARQSAAFIHAHQQPDGSFVNHGGKMKAGDNLAILYNTTQGVVALRALGQAPHHDPAPVMKRFFEGGAHKELPWYTTSFFPLFYAALGQPFPEAYREAISQHMAANQTPDGYLQNHVAAAFHMAHFYRLVGQETPRAAQMVERTLKDQKPDGGWNIFDPDWDVHACFDAVYILRQLGGGDSRCQGAIARAAEWVMECRNRDGGFGHYPGTHSDLDAVYFQFGTLVQAELIPGLNSIPEDAHTLSWGHAMAPAKPCVAHRA